MKLINVKHIYDRDGRFLYLSRYWLLGHESSFWAVMLHHMHRPDNDSCHHDHPWSFVTLVLRGGYVEQVTQDDGSVVTRRNGPGTLLYRRAEHTHRIDALPSGSCWTLVLRFRKRRPWGFWTKMGWVGWRRFIDERLGMGILWCDASRQEEKDDER